MRQGETLASGVKNIAQHLQVIKSKNSIQKMLKSKKV
jgi:hypothetical protein